MKHPEQIQSRLLPSAVTPQAPATTPHLAPCGSLLPGSLASTAPPAVVLPTATRGIPLNLRSQIIPLCSNSSHSETAQVLPLHLWLPPTPTTPLLPPALTPLQPLAASALDPASGPLHGLFPSAPNALPLHSLIAKPPFASFCYPLSPRPP